VTLIGPSATADDPAGTASATTESALRFPPHAFAAWGNETLAVGAGFNAPFGGGLRWPSTWRGRFELVEMKLQVLAGHISAAYALTPLWSIGATLSLNRASVALEKRIDFVDSEGQALLGGGGTAVGAGFGVSFAPTPAVRIGAAGRLPSTAALEGRVHFSEVPPAFVGLLPDQAIAAAIALPGRVGLGTEVAFSALTLFVEGELTFWSAFKSFDVEFKETPSLSVKQPRNWGTAGAVRVGVEREHAGVTVRAGTLFDGRASPADTLSPSLPDSHRLGFSLGAGREIGPVRCDLGYLFVVFLPRSSEGEVFPARYAARAHVVALTVRH
jgi:long-chain fatty acid transport protein